ncbi:KH domain-containing protein [Canibacter sp. lx-72]|uniref:KH domain-containing protein n=1 Tax=Canibacter zhuwentaonis TaxID=2837491 RepID=UPI001BDD3694|nr:KH domain-containing protein [Canibacter zhuwentaonis]MBT1017756.1 KH domain-containing protein [Canibacter zhuwentaonis]MBT1034911.1 KH domain-containing protein [Canibacter zhuwentaonis]
MSSNSSLQAILSHLVSGIVTKPEGVNISAFTDVRGQVLQVRVDPVDLGRVIGKRGRTVQALRTVISALAKGEPVRVEVVETDYESS